MIEVEGIRIAGLYLLLKKSETELDSKMKKLAMDIESYLYDRLSIDEMENLEKLYLENNRELEGKI